MSSPKAQAIQAAKLAARKAERADRASKGEPAPDRRANSPPSNAYPGLDAPRRFALELERGA